MRKEKKQQFHSIRVKLFLRMALIFLCAILLFLGLNRFALPQLYAQSAKRTMLHVADEVEKISDSSLGSITKLTTLEKENGISLDIYRKDGRQIYFGKSEFSSAMGKVTITNRKYLADGSSFETRRFERENTMFLVYARTLPNGNTLEMYSKMSTVDENTKIAILLTTCTSVAALLVALCFMYFFTGRFTKPLIEMRNVTKGIANMDFTRKCKSGAADEIGELSDSINRLSDSLKETLDDLSQKNAQLQKDIEKEHALEKMRKDFIASVSHELKTPISIISGYAEGAKLLAESGQSEKAIEYCKIIESEADRMNTLVLELLELSKYEAGAMQLQKENFDLCALLQEYLTASALSFEEKSITVETDFPPTAPVFADSSKIRMVCNNYIQNACAHAEGEKKLLISVTPYDETFLKLSVFNTGKQIPEEDLQKVWQSFYRADKAHSRKEGRFGLGLSIVEEIEKLHGAPYGVENTEDGVLFWACVEKEKHE